MGCNFAKREENRRFCSAACFELHDANTGRPGRRQPSFEFFCRECSKPFFMKKTYLTAYQKKWGKDPMYCSMPCSDKGRRKDSDERNKGTCQLCGTEFYRSRKKGSGTIYREQKFCSHKCKHASLNKTAVDRFNRGEYGRHIKRHGYVWISVPAMNGQKKREMLEHRFIMERKIGRKLRKEETVHHIDGNRQNNDPSNLELFSSRHGPGQRVRDKIAFAIEMLRLYPEFAREAGVGLVDLGQVNGLSLSSSPAGLLEGLC